MKSIISGAIIAAAFPAYLTAGITAKSINRSPIVAVSDTGKMEKMKMEKKTSKDKMKMSKKKMSKDSSKKM